MHTDNDGNPLEDQVTYETYEYRDMVDDTEVLVTLAVEHQRGDYGGWTDYWIESVTDSDGGDVQVSRSVKVMLQESAIREHLNEVRRIQQQGG